MADTHMAIGRPALGVDVLGRHSGTAHGRRVTGMSMFARRSRGRWLKAEGHRRGSGGKGPGGREAEAGSCLGAQLMGAGTPPRQAKGGR